MLAGAALAVGLGLTGCAEPAAVDGDEPGITVEEEFEGQDGEVADEDEIDPEVPGFDRDTEEGGEAGPEDVVG